MGSYYIGAMCWYAKNDIQHYQVKGAKHGVRRWQYKDGSLTPEGRIHYGVGPAREKKAADDANSAENKRLQNKYHNLAIRSYDTTKNHSLTDNEIDKYFEKSINDQLKRNPKLLDDYDGDIRKYKKHLMESDFDSFDAQVLSGMDAIERDGIDYVTSKSKYVDAFHREPAVEYARKVLGKNASDDEIDKLADTVSVLSNIKNYNSTMAKGYGSYDDVLKNTDFRHLPKEEKVKKELELTKLVTADSNKITEQQLLKVVDLQHRIETECGNIMRGADVTSRFAKAHAQWRDAIQKARDTRWDTKGHITEAMEAYREAARIGRDIVVAEVIKEIGYEDSPEIRDALYYIVFSD